MNKLGTGARASTSVTYGGFITSVSGQTYLVSASSWSGSASTGYTANVTPAYRWGMTNVSISSYSLEDSRTGTTYACSVSFISLSNRFRIMLNSGVSKPTSSTILTITYSYTDTGTKSTTTNRNYYYGMMDKTYTGSWVGIPFNSVTPLIPTVDVGVSADTDGDSYVSIDVDNPYPYPVVITNFSLWISESGGDYSLDESDLDDLIIPANTSLTICTGTGQEISDWTWSVTFGGGNTGYIASTVSG